MRVAMVVEGLWSERVDCRGFVSLGFQVDGHQEMIGFEDA